MNITYDLKKIKLVRDYSGKKATIFCDQGQIQQVLLNIFKNGTEAMHEHNREEKYKFTISIDINNAFILLSIADKGRGIPEEIAKHIFDPFYTTLDKRTELGLSISFFIIVQNHGGDIHIDGNYKNGTKFIIKFPLGGE